MPAAAPPVSVLFPVRDGAAWLRDSIASIRGQSDPDFEVLAVDDGSTDGTADLLADWARGDTRVRVLRQKPSGIVAALERARGVARGLWLARMDADDVSEPGRFAAQRALVEADPTVVACGTQVRMFPRKALRDGARRYEAWLNAATAPEKVAREIFVECPLAHPSFFLSAAALEAVGGYRDRGWPEDYDLLLRLWRAGGRLANVPEPLLRWRERPDRLQRTAATYGADAFVLCKVHHLRRSLLAERPVVAVWGAGPVGKTFARALAGAGVEVRAFIEVDPRKIGQEIHGAPVLDTAGGVALGRDVLHVAAVGQAGVRSTLRGLLEEAGLEEMRDFVAVA